MNSSSAADPARECREARDLALSRLREEGYAAAAYRVTAVEATAALGPGAWRVVLRPQRVTPQSSETELTAGGELFVDVDLATGEAAFRAGE